MELQNNYRTYNISLIPMESQFICLQEMLPFMLDIKLTSALVLVCVTALMLVLMQLSQSAYVRYLFYYCTDLCLQLLCQIFEYSIIVQYVLL